MEPVNRRKLIVPGGVVLISWGLYGLLAWRYPLGPSLVDPRASWATLVAPTILNAGLHLIIYLGLILLYIAILRLLRPNSEHTKLVVRWQLTIIGLAWLTCSSVLMFATPAGESHDVFDYLFRGRMMVEYDGNPLVDVPKSYSLATPYSRYLAWRKNVDTYGPVWEIASASVASGVRKVTKVLGWWDDHPAACPISGDSCRLLISYVSGYRLLAIVLTGLSGVLIFQMVRTDRPAWAALALAAWLLNPLTLVVTALGAHNDTLLILFLLVCWRLLQLERPFLALLLLILAAHIKLTAIVWLPACAFWIIWRWGWKRAIQVGLASAACGLALSWLLYIPFDGWGTLPPMLAERSAFLANSLWRVLKYLLVTQIGWPDENVRRLCVGLANSIFLIGAILIPIWAYNWRPKRWRRTPISPEDRDRTLWWALTAVSLWYLLAGAFWFQHWYVLWVLAPAVLLPDSRLTHTLLPWLAFGALVSNALMSFLLAEALQSGPLILKYSLPVALIWGPVLLAVIVIGIFRCRLTHQPAGLVGNNSVD